MCGIAGIFSAFSQSKESLAVTARKMAAALKHRGPDDEGCWTDAAGALALGHRRLSIIDLTRDGHQPMVSSCGRFVIVFNGEIYNYLELRDELRKEGFAFHGHSDTEVLLAALSHWERRRPWREWRECLPLPFGMTVNAA